MNKVQDKKKAEDKRENYSSEHSYVNNYPKCKRNEFIKQKTQNRWTD